MPVPASLLVFHEVRGLHHLPDVMEVRTDAAEDLVGAHRGGGGLRQARERHAVVVGAGSLLRELAQERMVEMDELHQRQVRRDAERFLKENKEAVREYGGDDGVDKTVCELFGDDGQ